MHLTNMEKLLLENIWHREQLLLAPIAAARQAAIVEIEERLGFPAGSIGTTHHIHPQTGEIHGPPPPPV